MKPFVADLVAMYRTLGLFERDAVCCGSVTIPQCVVLEALLDGPSEVGPLAERVGSSPSAMTRLVDGLVHRGLLERERDERDRRRVLVRLSREGRREAQRLVRATEDAVDGVLSAIPKSKRAQVVESIRLLRGAVDEAWRGCC